MDIAAQILPPDWMIDPKTVKVFQALDGGHSDLESLFVGGCVRNALMGVPVSDIDIATKHKPNDVLSFLSNAGVKAIPTGIEHGTITAVCEDRVFEITTLRKDVKTDGRHASVSFTNDWVEDSLRRDFTMNTLLANLKGEIFDPTGDGLKDIKAKRVRFVGNPKERIAEDYLRILRFFRFHGLYGEGEADSDALAACTFFSDKISTLSKERVTQEIFKILSIINPSFIIQLMHDGNVLKEALNSFHKNKFFKLCDIQFRFECVDLLTRFYLMCGQDMPIINNKFIFSNSQKKSFENIKNSYFFLNSSHSKQIKKSIYFFGNNATTQAYFLKHALHDDPIDLDVLDVARYWSAPKFPITGADLMEQGYDQGVALGERLKELEREWVDGEFIN